MSKKAYVGVNGIARNVSNIYVGVNGVARKVVKGYVGVNGVARQFWGASTPPFLESWDLWTTIPKTLVGIYYQSSLDKSIRKVNNLIAYYAMVHVDTGYSGNWSSFIMMSPFPDAVTYSEYDEVNDSELYRHTYKGTITDVNNIVWYYSGFDSDYNEDFYDFSPNCYLNGTIYDYSTDVEQAAQDLLDRVYAVPIKQNYSLTTYSIDFSDTADVEKTLRKAIGTSLFLNIDLYNTNAGYKQFSDNADTIISTALNIIGDKKFVDIRAITYSRVSPYNTDALMLFDYNKDNSSLDTKSVRMDQFFNDYGFKGWIGYVSNSQALQSYNEGWVGIMSDGTIRSGPGSDGNKTSFYFGVDPFNKIVFASNLTIDL